MEALRRPRAPRRSSSQGPTLAPARGELVLPGNIQAIAETPIFARSEGYLRKRHGRTSATASRRGSCLPWWRRPKSTSRCSRRQATLSRAEATPGPGQGSPWNSPNTQLKLAEVTAQRWNTLFAKRVVSRQEADEKQAAYEARRADNEAARANVAAATQAVAASQAELQRLAWN